METTIFPFIKIKFSVYLDPFLRLLKYLLKMERLQWTHLTGIIKV